MGKDMFKLGLNLLIISAVAALLLALTNSVTASTIAQRNEQANAEARKLVLESAQDFEQVKDVKTDNSKGVEVSEIYEAKDASGNTVGYTLKVLPSGYGGTIELMVGIDSVKGQVSGINVVSNSETAGLGAKATNPEFSDQYKGKPLEELSVLKNGTPGDTEIKAISGATITSTAVTNGVDAAIEVYNNSLK
ncbi:RnfABCDGE type electron transport complex subunit G [Intestinibacter bartlettii]|uniref:RnfABCDGE type electron transport complex subunit G n=1 Tax=Intestinibacter bartlettii TaxID=261299 RepID=UPI001D12B91A|nr:RnfABCDGE type electron transport complex subunit G [Intestinibacter bartlettii]MCC2705239.1 RnfABCDGE type electron transport complex subunit G [Intestinibacter bartlettii]MCC2760689.1 RnfABCDGE type electron transport complex subunit G [Intestinibacter bartlettii]MDU6472812.1 RnfABCDGE type electron transport complex subunit G [Intestinibacter bartlettii]